MAFYRILSFDDGGAWAPVLQAIALREVFGGQMSGHDILKQFQLVAASGGSALTLAALLMDRAPEAILKNWCSTADPRREIFAPRKWLRRKFSIDRKRDAVAASLGNVGKERMAALPGLVQEKGGRSPHFLVCAYDSDRKRAEFFRSHLTSHAASDTAAGNDPPLSDVVHAATTSPMSPFDGPAVLNRDTPNETRFWVGAVAGLYNPILAAVTEALANGQKASDILALSIGTGTAPLPKRKRRGDERLMLKKTNLAGDSEELKRSTLHDPPDTATFMAHVALGEDLPPSTQRIVSGSVVRLNPVIRPTGKAEVENWAAPKGFTSEEFEKLARLDKVGVDDELVELVRRCGEAWVKDGIDNQPIRVNSRFSCEVGHEKFSQAKEAWWKLTGSSSAAPAGEPPVAA